MEQTSEIMMVTSRAALSAFAAALLVLTPTQEAVGQLAPTIYVHGGGAAPAGDVGDAHNFGFSMGGAVGFAVTPRVSLQGAVGFHRLLRDDDAALERIGFDNGERFQAGGGFMEGGHRSALSLMANARMELLGEEAWVRPYLLAGAGFARTELGDIRVLFLQEPEEFEGDGGDTSLVGNVGAGVAVPLSPAVSIFGQGLFTRAFEDNGALQFTVFQLGLSFRTQGGP